MPRVAAEKAAKRPYRKAQPRSTYDHDDKATEPFDLATLTEGGPEIEVIGADQDIQRVIEDAAFMNENIEIRFHEANDANAPLAVEVDVRTRSADGKKAGKQYKRVLMRGVKHVVPRFVAEALAHSKNTKLVRVDDPRDPMNVKHIQKSAFYYPFEVVRDPNPKGRAWLDKVLADPS